jgi:hypothetical protein
MFMSMIVEAEKQRRQRAVASSQGSLAMEGLQLDSVSVELSRRYAEGEIDLHEFGRLTDQHLAQLAARAKAEEFSAVA